MEVLTVNRNAGHWRSMLHEVGVHLLLIKLLIAILEAVMRCRRRNWKVESGLVECLPIVDGLHGEYATWRLGIFSLFVLIIVSGRF